MRRFHFVSFILLLLLALAWVAAASPEAPHLVVISIDGLVPEYYVRPDRLGLHIPNLRKLTREGAYAEGVIGVYPTVTYPSHTALVTGAKPADHGIIANSIFDDPSKPPKRWWYWESSYIKTDTLWAAARRSGLSVASLFWPVTVGADQIDWNIPEIWDPFADPVFSARVLQEHATPGLLDEILKSQNRSLKGYQHTDESAVTAAVYVIERYKPNLLLVHLIDLDHTHHEEGPYSGPAFEMVEREDADVGRILDAIKRAGIEPSTTVAVVSDHGFMRVDKEFNPSVLLVREGLIRLNERGRVVSWEAALHNSGGSAAVYLKKSQDQAVYERVRALFETYTKGPEAPLRQILTREELRQLGANPSAALFLEPAAHFAIGDRLRGPVVEMAREKRRGKHGYLPERPEMYASLILWGRGVRPRARLELVRMTDVAPTLAQVLSIKFQPPDYSRPLTALLTEAPPTENNK
ncbi:MAG: alkaline phosphatase family protein [Acidobacteria bacterium]|nr:alkaline phosphatase family protein [Acidobacteriota bacterium]